MIEQEDRVAFAATIKGDSDNPGRVGDVNAILAGYWDTDPVLVAYTLCRRNVALAQAAATIAALQARVGVLEGAARVILARLDEAEREPMPQGEPPVTDEDAVAIGVGELRAFRAALKAPSHD